jgi:hypothetical protein
MQELMAQQNEILRQLA